MSTIALTREQRDGLQDLVAVHLAAGSLGHMVRDKDGDAVKALVRSLPACIRVLDQIGWSRRAAPTAMRSPSTTKSSSSYLRSPRRSRKHR